MNALSPPDPHAATGASPASAEAVGLAMRQMGVAAKGASRVLATSSTDARNHALRAAATALEARRSALEEANAEDMRRAAEDAEEGAAEGAAEGALDAALLDRLALTPARIDAMLEGLHQVAGLPDPIGQLTDMQTRPSGIRVGKMRVPLGVIGIIYESRPNVTADAGSLCLKSGNAVILRGGSEAMHSNRIIAAALAEGIQVAGLPAASLQLVHTRDRAAVGALLALEGLVDVVIPRGGRSLIERVVRDARVPVIKHLDGVCHVYIDRGADPHVALPIADNAKTHRYGTCNTMETLLVHAAEADALLPALGEIFRSKGVALRACERSRPLLPDAAAATEADWSTEYLAPILAVRVVETIDEAIAHINRYGSGHTDAIVTSDYGNSQRFVQEVDSSSVIVNASTRFADGFEYGLGAEIGISTDKLHARGPVGLEGLTSQKYVVFGQGQIRR